MTAFIDLTGQRFGSWAVLERASNSKGRKARWLCRCDCGRERVVLGGKLRSGHSKGCKSCHMRNIKTKHGQAGTRLYYVWANMIQRCENSNNERYKNCGDRGIKICSEWRNSFVLFQRWALANGYEKGLMIDRINGNGNYEPENCQFITKKEQAQNSKHTRLTKPEYPKMVTCKFCEEKYRLVCQGGSCPKCHESFYAIRPDGTPKERFPESKSEEIKALTANVADSMGGKK